MKKYTIVLSVIAILIIAGCDKSENDRREAQRRVKFTAEPLNGKVTFETIDDPKNVIKDEASLNSSEPKAGQEGFIEKDERWLDRKKKFYKVVGLAK